MLEIVQKAHKTKFFSKFHVHIFSKFWKFSNFFKTPQEMHASLGGCLTLSLPDSDSLTSFQSVPSREKSQVPSREKSQVPSREKSQVPSRETSQVPSREKS
jgi:hypothetical protein